MSQLSLARGVRGRAAGDGMEWEGDLGVFLSPPPARMSCRSLDKDFAAGHYGAGSVVGVPLRGWVSGLAMCGAERP